MFDNICREVRELIASHKVNEITRDSNFHSAGVYMLYVDCFEDDKIIPFYIGQTSDFQERHKQHFTEVMALNRLNRECYEYALYADLYNGHARPCKIFSYMVNHGCTLKDLHMIVLEMVEDEQKRVRTEQRLIDELYAPFFGFNQINSVLRYIELGYGNEENNEYIQSEEQDIEKMLRFSIFGYNLYNWYRVCDTFIRTITVNQPGRKVPEEYISVLKSSKRLEEIKLRLAEIRHYNNWQAETDAWDICKETINTFFAERNLKSEDKKKLSVKVLLFDSEDDRKQLEKYFAKYSDGIDGGLRKIIDRIHGKEIQHIKQKVTDNQHEYHALKKEKEVLNYNVLGSLLPKPYRSHPLGAMEEKLNNIASDEENACYINVEFTCFKADYNYGFYPIPTRVDYCIIRNGRQVSRTVYIDNPLTTFFERDDVYYCESGFPHGPFRPYLSGNIETHISVTMEYKNGINEWSLRDRKTEDFQRVFKEINGLIDEKTKVVYSSSGYKRTILKFAEIGSLANTMLMKKLKHLCK